MKPDLQTSRRTTLTRLLAAVSLAVVAISLPAPAAAQTAGSDEPVSQPVPSTGGTPAAQTPDVAPEEQPATDAAAPAEAPATEDIVITGFRGSLARALNLKRQE